MNSQEALPLTSQSRMASMVSRSFPCRSWNRTTSRAAWISSRSPLWSGTHSSRISCSSRLYLLILCTGFSRYDERSMLSPNSICLRWTERASISFPFTLIQLRRNRNKCRHNCRNFISKILRAGEWKHFAFEDQGKFHLFCLLGNM